MILRKKGFTLIEMLVVIMIIAILAAALFPAISAAIAQAKSTAMKNKGRGIWTSVISANAEREPLAMAAVWPGASFVPASSTAYFQFLLGGKLSGSTVTAPVAGDTPICEDLKVTTLAGAGINPSVDPASFDPNGANNAWCCSVDNGATNPAAEDAFIFTRNIDFSPSTKANKDQVLNSDYSKLTSDGTLSGGFSLNRGIYVTYGGACIDRRDKYMGLQQDGVSTTNNLLSSTNSYYIYRPKP